jgi:hypothetical protein
MYTLHPGQTVYIIGTQWHPALLLSKDRYPMMKPKLASDTDNNGHDATHFVHFQINNNFDYWFTNFMHHHQAGVCC